MPKAATPIFTQEELNKVERALYASWNAVAPDADPNETYDNETAMEVSADAGRMRMFGDKNGVEAQELYTKAIEEHGYDAVQKYLCDHVTLV